MRIVVDIVVARGARILQLFYMETVWDRDVVRIDLRGGTLDTKDLLMATDAVRIDLVQFGRKTCMLPIAPQRKDVDARHQGVTCRMALRAIDLGMHGRLLPKGGFPLLMMTGDAEFLFGRRIGGEGNGRIKHENDQGSAQGPCPERKMWNLRNLEVQRLLLLTFVGGTKQVFGVEKIRNPNFEIRNKFQFSKFKSLKTLSLSNIRILAI